MIIRWHPRLFQVHAEDNSGNVASVSTLESAGGIFDRPVVKGSVWAGVLVMSSGGITMEVDGKGLTVKFSTCQSLRHHKWYLK